MFLLPDSDMKADVVLMRRPEVSRQGRLLRLNGINNEGEESLTLIFRYVKDFPPGVLT